MVNSNLIIDTDAGADDLLALMLTIKSGQFNIKKIFSSYGNYYLEQSHQRLNYLTHLINSDISSLIIKGSSKPISKMPFKPKNIHGSAFISKNNTSNFYSSFIQKFLFYSEIKNLSNSQQTIYVGLGPLTNLAKLIKFNKHQFKAIYLVGGCLFFPGNTTALSEANFFWDPKSTLSVLKSHQNLHLIPLNITETVQLSLARLNKLMNKKLIKQFFLPYSNYYLKKKKFFVDYQKNPLKKNFYQGGPLHDVIAITHLINNQILSFEKIHLSLDEVIRHPGFIFPIKKPSLSLSPSITIKVATQINTQLFWQVINKYL